TGLAHDHVRLSGSGRLLRVPKQSQLGLSAAANLAYQAACFKRAAPGGHTPLLHRVLEPGQDLPMGALEVEEIRGPVSRLPDQLSLLAQALAALHGLPLPPAAERPPLRDPDDPVAAVLEEVRAQGEYLDRAGLHPQALERIRLELAAAERDLDTPHRPPKTLISFDAHPGNFLVERDRAVLVDLEKGRYGAAGFDLAHATLYTSTTWDIASYAELSPAQVAGFYACWLEAVPGSLARASRPWLLPLRRIMWLWSVTWCAKWRVQSAASAQTAKHRLKSTEDWSAQLSEAPLVAHVAGRVEDYLSPRTVQRVCRDWRGDNPLTDLLKTSSL
ncbi:MAG: aminoglycoside phosphotransferase family protein, partial [Candidatus Competibacteraceae bacterium]|nr:aminoglycoside phosphotransferase family protein [Candidatus Competibacteraceae bacterium]